jgi:hypothetical protein
MGKPRDDRQDDLFRPPLEQIIDLRHPLARSRNRLWCPDFSRIFSKHAS